MVDQERAVAELLTISNELRDYTHRAIGIPLCREGRDIVRDAETLIDRAERILRDMQDDVGHAPFFVPVYSSPYRH